TPRIEHQDAAAAGPRLVEHRRPARDSARLIRLAAAVLEVAFGLAGEEHRDAPAGRRSQRTERLERDLRQERPGVRGLEPAQRSGSESLPRGRAHAGREARGKVAAREHALPVDRRWAAPAWRNAALQPEEHERRNDLPLDA